MDEERFGAWAPQLDQAMVIVTVRALDDGERSGCLVGFATQCSIDPPRLVVCLSKTNHTFRVARRADTLAVQLIPPAARAVAELFGAETGDVEDKFAACAWTDHEAGPPLLTACPAWCVGHIRDRVDFGDHVGHVLEPVAMGTVLPSGAPGEPLGPRVAAAGGSILRLHDLIDLEPGHQP